MEKKFTIFWKSNENNFCKWLGKWKKYHFESFSFNIIFFLVIKNNGSHNGKIKNKIKWFRLLPPILNAPKWQKEKKTAKRLNYSWVNHYRKKIWKQSRRSLKSLYHCLPTFPQNKILIPLYHKPSFIFTFSTSRTEKLFLLKVLF